LVAWSELQSALATASNSASASPYELRAVSSDAAATSQSETNLMRAWMHMPVERVFDAWTERHECVEQHQTIIAEELQLLKGRTSKQLTDEQVWTTEEEEQEAR
jgi:hypothetical protein